MFAIDTRKLSQHESLLIEGTLDEDIFQLGPDDPRPSGPLAYRAVASELSGELLLRGDFVQPFQVACVRCLEPFEYSVRLQDHALLVPLGDAAVIDLTDALREDILLALPSFPHCDAPLADGSPAPRECPAAGSFQLEDGFAPLDPPGGESSKSDSWGALDQLKLDEP